MWKVFFACLRLSPHIRRVLRWDRHCSRIVDIRPAQGPRADPLLALAGSVTEILDSLLVADRPWDLSAVVTRFRGNERWNVPCDG